MVAKNCHKNYTFYMDVSEFKRTRKINLHGVFIGGGSPVTIQTMWKSPIDNISDNDITAIKDRVKMLNKLGCDILRFAVPNENSARNLVKISKMVDIPLVADIHFDYKLALMCLMDDSAVAAIRINPGNIGSVENVKAVTDACRDAGVAIRIGVNSGSIEKSLLKKIEEGKIDKNSALVESAINESNVLENLNFQNYAVSIKATGGRDTIITNEKFRQKSLAPLHIGVTESGPLVTGVVRSSLALGHLLEKGIGDTIRVSLSDTMENEVIAARTILEELSIRRRGVNIISCPRCGRQGFDVHGFMARWQNKLLSDDALNKKGVTIAVMGCVVNGVGEGRAADIGVSGSGEQVVFFKKGEVVEKITTKDAESVDNMFRELLDTEVADVKVED